MKPSVRWFLYLIPVLLCCGLTIVYLFAIKQKKLGLAMPTVTDSGAVYAQVLNVHGKRTLDYTPLYMGKWQEEINISNSRNADSAHTYERGFGLRYRLSDSLDFQLLVDTTRFVAGYAEKWEEEHIRLKPIKSRPVLLANLSDDTLHVGSAGKIMCIQEALDSTGRWRSIEAYRYTCGIVPGMYLPPGEIVILATPVYEGTYHTRLRLRLGNLFSPEYAGSINPGQFDYAW